jgi:predicted metal-dependent HD superfamily phosphohydrolase
MILVDSARWRWRGQLWAHLISDRSYEELHGFAARLGIPRRAFQGDHYDLPSDYRDQAILLGATAVSSRELVRRLRAAGLRRRSGFDAARAWTEAVVRLGGRTQPAERSGAELEERYREPHRRFHTGVHRAAVLAHAEVLAGEVGLSASDRAMLVLAVCAHDVVYDARPGEDEQASADWARARLDECGVSHEVIERVANAVLATATHSSEMHDVVTDVLLDADLAILAAPEAVYDEYVEAVRTEYSALDDQSWHLGRARLLESLSARPHLYVTPAARARWDAAARGNLHRELKALRAE